MRPIARLLQVYELSDLADYFTVLREKNDEVQALLRDLLISVTNFFRDKEAFAALELDIIPFSRLDLITCRNLLIYLERDTQEKIFEVFHFALRPSGYLFLGSSESAESVTSLFQTLDKKHRLYQYAPAPTSYASLPTLPAPGRWNITVPEITLETKGTPPSYGDIHYKLLETFAPPSVLIDEDYMLVHVSEHAGRYLQIKGGAPTHNLLEVIHPALRLECPLRSSGKRHQKRSAGRALSRERSRNPRHDDRASC